LLAICRLGHFSKHSLLVLLDRASVQGIQRVERILEVEDQGVAPTPGEVLADDNPHQLDILGVWRLSGEPVRNSAVNICLDMSSLPKNMRELPSRARADGGQWRIRHTGGPLRG
jgi:hypothetical protein